MNSKINGAPSSGIFIVLCENQWKNPQVLGKTTLVVDGSNGAAIRGPKNGICIGVPIWPSNQ